MCDGWDVLRRYKREQNTGKNTIKTTSIIIIHPYYA
jgi:hypothetical protein